MLKYKDNINIETKYKEYKEFNFFTGGLSFSNNDAVTLLENNLWIFNKLVNTCINNMIETYLPKYTCAYLSHPLEYNGELYFGVNDSGDIIGIPYQGTLNIDKIMNKIYSVFKKRLEFKGNIFDYVDIDIIKLDDSTVVINNSINPYLLKYYKYQKIYDIKKEKFLAKLKIWYTLMDRYNAKLTDLVNNKDTRYELINYIQNKDFYNPVIKLLRTNYIMTQVNIDDIISNKKKNNNIIFWVTDWKDTMLRFVKTIRPRFNYRIPSKYYPLNIIILIKTMIPYWIKYNKNINLYLIKFTFKTNNKYDIRYKNIYNEWTTCKRSMYNGEPCCIHN
jgi:hypothetical protein